MIAKTYLGAIATVEKLLRSLLCASCQKEMSVNDLQQRNCAISAIRLLVVWLWVREELFMY